MMALARGVLIGVLAERSWIETEYIDESPILVLCAASRIVDSSAIHLLLLMHCEV